MSLQPNVSSLANTIRNIYKQDPANASSSIENFLTRELNFNTVAEKQQTMKELVAHFKSTEPEQTPSSFPADDQFLHFCSILLGHPVNSKDLQTDGLQQRLSESLTAIFETLNQLIKTINQTLLEDDQTQETIRFFIGEQLTGSLDAKPLKEHLDQIRTAFVTSHTAFKEAMQITVEKILNELDPETLKEKNSGGLTFNPLRKVDGFNQYGKIYKDCRQWFESGHCMKEFLRTFEKQCSTTPQPLKR